MRKRIAGAAGLGEVLALIVVLGFPACLGDPYADLDPRLAALWLSNVSEARSIVSLMRDLPHEVLPYYGLPVIALALGLYRCRHETDERSMGLDRRDRGAGDRDAGRDLAGARQRGGECTGAGGRARRRWCGAFRRRTGGAVFFGLGRAVLRRRAADQSGRIDRRRQGHRLDGGTGHPARSGRS